MSTDSNIVIAVVGATGLVGQEMLSILEERNIQCQVRLLASSDSEGEIYSFQGEQVTVQPLGNESFDGADYALFATSAELAEQFVPFAIESGTKVIDNSRQFRMDPEVPLVVPEVNFDQLASSANLIANPNCSTIQLAPVLSLIEQEAGLERVIVSTYQAVSGAGRDALDELFEQTRAVFSQQELSRDVFAHPIAFNCIPQIDTFLDDGSTREERKIIDETRKILGLPELRITATAVRVPVFHSHAESVNVETKSALNPERLNELLEEQEYIRCYPNFEEFPMQLDATGGDEIHVGRVRVDHSVENGLSLWVVSDNLRKGAALNAVQILERLLAQEITT